MQELKEHTALDEGDPLWWTVRSNREKAQQYATAHQWAAISCPPDMNQTVLDTSTRKDHPMDDSPPLMTTKGSAMHGTAHLGTEARDIYFDLGGEFNLADE